MRITERMDGYRRIIDIQFNSLRDLYNYLSSNPKINRNIFSSPSSQSADTEFHGESYETALQYLRGGYDIAGLDNFLKTNEELKKIGKEFEEGRRLEKGLFGGIPLAPLVAAGVPDCWLRYNRNTVFKEITIYYSLGYPARTKPSQIINRGLATLYILQALEEKGYIINFKAIELSICEDEIVNISIGLKEPGDTFLNVANCYYPIKGKEFLRRILFRVLESQNVRESYWNVGYGHPGNIDEIRDFYNASKDDLIIGYPELMGICGYDLVKDIKNMIAALGIEDEFDMDKLNQYNSEADLKRPKVKTMGQKTMYN